MSPKPGYVEASTVKRAEQGPLSEKGSVVEEVEINVPDRIIEGMCTSESFENENQSGYVSKNAIK
jgi:hypothetical protein